MGHFLPWLRNNMKLIVSPFNESLLALNHLNSLRNSEFIAFPILFTPLYEKNMLVSSANITNFNN